MILGGHVPNSISQYNVATQLLQSSLEPYNQHALPQNITRFVELFKLFKPRHIHNTTNLLYMLQNTGTQLYADNVEELHSYMPIEKEEVAAEEEADDDDEEEADDGDY
jgi:hypothetical protein